MGRGNDRTIGPGRRERPRPCSLPVLRERVWLFFRCSERTRLANASRAITGNRQQRSWILARSAVWAAVWNRSAFANKPLPTPWEHPHESPSPAAKAVRLAWGAKAPPRALELIRQAIREGWLDGNEHSDRRDRLVATLCGLLDIEYLPTAEVISLCRTFFAMTRSDLDSELAAIKAERAKRRADI